MSQPSPSPEPAAPPPQPSLPPFRARGPWWGGDLQTVRNPLLRARADLAPWPTERLTLALGDGDVLPAALHRPDAAGRPLVLLIHGLTGCEDSAYVRTSARALLAADYPVLRLNLRGAGPARATCRQQYHAGRSDDLRRVLAVLPAGLTDAGLVAVGFSLGANMLLKFLGEEGAVSPFVAAAAISAPIDLAGCSDAFLRPRNALYHRWLLARMRAEATAGAAEVTAKERAAIAAARSTWAFDDGFVAPRNSFAGAADYYARCSAAQFLPAVRTRTLVVHARNDPWIPADPYDRIDWAGNPWLTPAIVAGGGHVGFHGRGSGVPWHDRAIASFLDAVLAP